MSNHHMALPAQSRPPRRADRPWPATAGPALAHAVLTGFDDAQLQWCLLRGDVDGLVHADDIDVLVAPCDLARAVDIIEAHGFVWLRSYGRASHRFFLGFDLATGAWVTIDLVTELAYGPHFEVRTAVESQCLARRQRRHGIWTLSPEDEFWALLLHCVLDKGAVPDHHRRRLAQLHGKMWHPSPLRHAALLAVGTVPTSHGAWSALAARRGRALAAWWRAHPVAVSRRVITSRVLWLIERPLQAWSRRGARVALLGPDGSGKSTLASGIEAAFYFPVRKVYMGLWASTDAPTGPAANLLRIVLRPITVWRRYLTAVRHQAYGRLVVFDRYVYDALLPPRGSLAWLKRPYFLLLSRLCPAPDMVVLLDAPGSVMHQRSQEYDPEHLEAERAYYQRLRQRIPDLLLVDANRPPEVVLADVLGRIWQHYLQRSTR